MPPFESYRKNMKIAVKYYPLFLISFFILLLIFTFGIFQDSVFAGTTPPTTTHQFSGTLGENNWYTSTVDVTLRTSDLESGPKSTTYWLDSNPPTTINYGTTQNQILNPSFEETVRHGFWPFYWYSIKNWGDNDCPSCWVLFWSSTIYSKFGSRSAAIGILGSGTYYYHNRDYYVTVVSGNAYSFSTWVRTLNIWGNPGAWMEVWARGSGGIGTDVKLAESSKVSGTTSWTLLSTTATMPAGYDKVYVRLVLEDSGFLGAAWWDGVSMFGGTDFFTTFTVVENGSHYLYYYSKDNNNNTESVHSTQLKIDTIGPTNWDQFDFEQDLINTNSYKGEIQVQDVTSGVQVSTAEYAYYSEENDEEWDHDGDGNTDWYPIGSLEKVPSGAPVSDGETGVIKMITPFIDFGSQGGPKRIQFRLKDMAGNLTSSAVMTIGGPWIEVVGLSDIYSRGSILMSNEPLVEGIVNTNAYISAGGSEITNFTTSSNISVPNYSYKTASTISDLIPDYSLIKKDALDLPDNKLPISSGVYLFEGDYTIDFNTISSGFTGNEIQALIIIDGDLQIQDTYALNPNSNVVFIVEDNIDIKGEIAEIDGFFISGGIISTNYDSLFNEQLTVNGGLISLGEINLGRDLGKEGTPSNLTDSSEKIVYLPQYYFNSYLNQILGGSQVSISWEEQ